MTLTQVTPLLEIGGTAPVAAGPGWRVISADDRPGALAAIAAGVGLILIHSDDDTDKTVAAIRTSGLAAGAVPIAILGDTRAPDPSGPGADVHIAGSDVADIPAALSPWHPQRLPEAYDRLETAFGAETVRGMAQRLCTVLADALSALGTPDAADAAHKVAGVAGTLGFGELGEQWLAVSHDPGREPPTLRRDTRTTIAAIVLRTGTGV